VTADPRANHGFADPGARHGDLDGDSSRASKRILERLDAVLEEIDEQDRYPTFGKVAIVAVVGDEDGAHHVTAEF
jgi:hypothetical protein